MDKENLSLRTIDAGAVAEQFDIALMRVLENIHDINTTDAAREITLKAVFKPLSDERRDILAFKVSVATKLCGQPAIIGSADMKIVAGKLVAQTRPKEKLVSMELPKGQVVGSIGKE